MRAAVVVFPGSNCDRDMAVAFKGAGAEVRMVWHKEDGLPDGLDVVGLPGGFSFGDYLRSGAIAANSPVFRSVATHAERGGYVLGVCNGFQMLTETGLLPGTLLRNAGIKFLCAPVDLTVETATSAFTAGYGKGARIAIPVACGDGNYFADSQTVARLRDEDRIAFRYADNPNGSVDAIAGVLSQNRRILGMMPHPERAAEPAHGCVDGRTLFRSLLEGLAAA